MARVTIVIHSHLCMAPRPIKEADALVSDGHEVTILGCWTDSALSCRDLELCVGRAWKYLPVVDLSPRRACNHFRYRLQARASREAFARANILLPDVFGYATGALQNKAISLRADLTIAHSEGGLFIANQLMRRGYRVGVDFEDWFSQDLPQASRTGRPATWLFKLEKNLFLNSLYRLTPSKAMGLAMQHEFGGSLPEVVYNCFPHVERSPARTLYYDRMNPSYPSLYWFSQTIGPGRGLETLFQALQSVEHPFELHLRGNYPEHYKRTLHPLIPEQHRERIFFHSTLPPHTLAERMREHDIGLAIEENTVRSTNLTVSNKLFQYMQAGLAVIATNTAGQSEILTSHPDAAILVSPGDPQSLSNAINKLLEDNRYLLKSKKAAFSLSSEKYDFSIYSERIRQLAKIALK